MVYKVEFLIENQRMKFWEFIFILPFALGLFVLIKAPLSSRYPVPSWADALFGVFLTIVVMAYFYMAYFYTQMGPSLNAEPCSPLSKQIECYTINEDTCRSAWSSSYGNCNEKLQSVLKSRPSFLSGSFMETCQGKNFDKMMHYNRKNKTSLRCQTYFGKIDNQD